ncbi:hypothetical protein F5884DRAFT_837992 [Xylogone sp. PMI_703]|nr:hypothetical protein F5884DRAFT_837992 [Xylogone sp. PMI_703]
MTYLLDAASETELAIDSVRLSEQGGVKLVLDIHYQTNQQKCVANQQFYAAFLIEIIRILMDCCPSGENAWSQEALDFSLISTFTSFTNHSFLNKAVVSSRLIPRIRRAIQMLGFRHPRSLQNE